MRPIPLSVRKEIDKDPWFKKCVWTNETQDITIEHPWVYSGRQIVDKWASCPLVRRLNTTSMPARVKDYCRLITLCRATPEDLAKYPKRDWVQEKKKLTYKLYGNRA